jgi:hypothetical protein
MGRQAGGIPGVTAFNGKELAPSATPSPSMLTCSTIRLRAHLRQGKIFHPPTNKKRSFSKFVTRLESRRPGHSVGCVSWLWAFIFNFFSVLADHHDETFLCLSLLFLLVVYGSCLQREKKPPFPSLIILWVLVSSSKRASLYNSPYFHQIKSNQINTQLFAMFC